MKFIDIFFPPICPICKSCTDGSALCSECDKKLIKLFQKQNRSVNVDENRIKTYYLCEYDSNELKTYIFALKKHSGKALFCHAAQRLYEFLKEIPVSENTVITSIPRRKKNVREFGYDHACKIAKEVARMSQGLLKYKTIIKRRGFSVDQKELSAAKRRENVKGKFYAVKKETVKNVILFDDVVTTGSSFSECVRALKTQYGEDIEITGLFIASSKQRA